MKKKDRITKGLREVGAAWAVSNDRYCSPNDPLEDQVEGKCTYHVHPDASYPHQENIVRFRNLDEIAAYIAARKKANALIEAAEGRHMESVGDGDDLSYYDLMADASKIMDEFWASLSPL